MAKATTRKPRDVVKARPPKQTTTDATDQAKVSGTSTTDAAKPAPDVKPVIHIALAEGSKLTGEQIAHMVSRFLAWKLPDTFRPDAGISFEPTFDNGTPEGGKREPSGTNLFDASQAEQMVLHMIEGLPGVDVAAKAVASLESWATDALKAELERRGETPAAPADIDAAASPLQVALAQGAELAATLVRVTGPKGGRWRAGQHFTEAARELPVTDQALVALEADPALKVERL